MTNPSPDDEMTTGEVALECKVSVSTVRRWDRYGVLKPCRRLPGSGYRRYDRTEVETLKRELADGGAP